MKTPYFKIQRHCRRILIRLLSQFPIQPSYRHQILIQPSRLRRIPIRPCRQRRVSIQLSRIGIRRERPGQIKTPPRITNLAVPPVPDSHPSVPPAQESNPAVPLSGFEPFIPPAPGSNMSTPHQRWTLLTASYSVHYSAQEYLVLDGPLEAKNKRIG